MPHRCITTPQSERRASHAEALTGHDFGNLIAACKEEGTAVMAIRVFAAGVLATDVRHGREVIITSATDVGTEERRARAVFSDLGNGYGTRALDRAALRSPTRMCRVRSSLAEPAHLEEALAGAALGPLPAGTGSAGSEVRRQFRVVAAAGGCGAGAANPGCAANLTPRPRLAPAPRFYARDGCLTGSRLCAYGRSDTSYVVFR
jgi:hypothetical protein